VGFSALSLMFSTTLDWLARNWSKSGACAAVPVR
jgi:hypothetical protein